jgi:predicted pyridoxine 5'-phosphate oxidase superfamily flavin-nucleotide-binding protein
MSANTPSSDVGFTASVKAIQERRGSRKAYRRMEERGGWETRVTPELAAFLGERDSAYLATATSAGHPYIQHRGGPKGFIRVLDDKTLGFADFVGNRQYITTGNPRRERPGVPVPDGLRASATDEDLGKGPRR